MTPDPAAWIDHMVLVESLRFAVPMWVDELRRLPADIREQRRYAWASESAQHVAERGDALQFGGKRGSAAAVFNSLARGLAAAAYQSGGITFAGVHWCMNHTECEEAEREAAARPSLLDRPDPPPAPPVRPIVDVHLPEVL
jgi:hypothetical protein